MDEETIYTVEQLYEFIETYECPWLPDKCKERHFWYCPDCGKVESGNCAIVKLNRIASDRWVCWECYEKLLDLEWGNYG